MGFGAQVALQLSLAPHVRFGSILLKNVFGDRPEEYFFRNTPLWRISIQELGPSDSEILHFFRSSGMPAAFSTVSTQSGHERRSARGLATLARSAGKMIDITDRQAW